MVAEIEVNKVFWPALTCEHRYVHSYGGRGSGKSHHEALNFVLRLIAPTFFRGVLVRSVADTIRGSQFQLIKDIIEHSELSHVISVNEQRMSFECAKTGNSIISMGLKKSSKRDTAKFKSLADPTHVWIEEAEEVEEGDFNKIDGSIRKIGVKCQIRLTYNTDIDESHWLRLRFHKVKRPDTFYLFTTYIDNVRYLNEDYIASRGQLATTDPERYDVEVLGLWGHKKIKRPFATAFTDAAHVKPCAYDRERVLHVSMDFNLDPMAFIYAHVWTDKHGSHIHVFDEETIPSASIEEACNRIIERFGFAQLGMLTLTGDYSGTARSMIAPDGRSIYRLIQQRLSLTTAQLDLKPNPRHVNSRHDVNFALRNITDFRIDPKCVHLCRDLRTVEVDSEGTIIKVNRKDDSQLADHLDALRYLINSTEVKSILKTLE